MNQMNLEISLSDTVFSCQKCGKCCEGEGGIVLSPQDLVRLANFLGLAVETAKDRYATPGNGKLKIITGKDGHCIFFQMGKGCAIHPVKPAVCRAWPYFRGNLVDEESFMLAREFCPGISRTCTHAEFVRTGLEYLQAELSPDSRNPANALKIDWQSLKKY